MEKKPFFKVGDKITARKGISFKQNGQDGLQTEFGSAPWIGEVGHVNKYQEVDDCHHISVKWPGTRLSIYGMIESEFEEYHQPEEFKPGDIVKLKNPYADFYRFGGISIAKTNLIAAKIPISEWRARVESVSPESILIHFLDIISGYYKFSRDEIYKSTESPSIPGGTCTLSSLDLSGSTSAGEKTVVLGSTQIPKGEYSVKLHVTGFHATPSGHVETLNEFIPLFKRIEVQGNKIPTRDLE